MSYLDKEELVKDFIQCSCDIQIPSKLVDVKRLSGGLANFVYRLYFEDENTFILKYFADHMASSLDFKISRDRYFIEKEALKILGNNEELNKNSNVRVPKLIYSNDEHFFVIMEDAGENLKTISDLFKSNNHDQLSTELISKLAENIHYLTYFLQEKSGITLEKNKVFENEIGWNILSNYYPSLCENQAKKVNLEKELDQYLKQIPSFVTKPANPDEAVFVFGDLWPNSILVDLEKNLIWIVDWEIARFHTRTSDVQQLFGNLWIMKQNPRLFNLNSVELLIKKLQLQYFGDEKRDWRENCGANGKANFIFWVLALVTFDHWQINDQKEVIMKALNEIC